MASTTTTNSASASSSSSSSLGHRFFRGWFRGRPVTWVTTTAAVVGTGYYLYQEYQQLLELQDWEDTTTRSKSEQWALSIAFDELELVQQPLTTQEKLLRRLWHRGRQTLGGGDDGNDDFMKNSNNNSNSNDWWNSKTPSPDNTKLDPNSSARTTGTTNDETSRSRAPVRRRRQVWGTGTEHCTISVVELVRLLHTAAQDRHVTALFGTFGNGPGVTKPPTSFAGNGNVNGSNRTNTSLGWADWEEIRNALTVFAQSHRRHYEPVVPTTTNNNNHNNNNNNNASSASETDTTTTSAAAVGRYVPRVDRKPMYCFASNLASSGSMMGGDGGNPTYYLASVFHRIHLQTHGELALLGMVSQNVFLKPLLDQYGIVFHVLKHGAYKTAPNTWTEAGFTPPHKESVTNLVSELDATVSLEITYARSKALLTSWLATKGGSGGKAIPRYDPHPYQTDDTVPRDPATTTTTTATTSLQPHSTLSPTNPFPVVNTSNKKSKNKNKNSSSSAATLSYTDSSNAKILQLWQRIHEAGTFPASVAYQTGMVDCVCRRHPLHALLAYNRAQQEGRYDEAQHIRSTFGPQETDFEHYSTATHVISLADYQYHLERLQRLSHKRRAWATLLQQGLGLSLSQLPSWLQPPTTPPPPYHDPSAVTTTTTTANHKNNASQSVVPAPKERIVCLDVIGAIDDAQAKSVVSKLRALQASIAKQNQSAPRIPDTDSTTTLSTVSLPSSPSSPSVHHQPEVKCLLLRIVSPGGQIHACEQILQELQALSIPIVVSMGHVAASGGYYIAAPAQRIFSLNKTITGSIGVFGIRADLTDWAKRNGIVVEHVAAGTLAPSYHILAPMTGTMKQNLAGSIQRWYDLFQYVVQHGRRLSPETVHELAQGKVWTGRQAKEVGLVDEIGGFERALAYAKRTYCPTTAAEHVEVGRLVATGGNPTSPSSSTPRNTMPSSSFFWNPVSLLTNYVQRQGPFFGDDPTTTTEWQWQSDSDVIPDPDWTAATTAWLGFGRLSPYQNTVAATPAPSTFSLQQLSEWLLGHILSSSSSSSFHHTTNQSSSLSSSSSSQPSLSGILMTVDESSAIQMLLQDQYQKYPVPSSSSSSSLNAATNPYHNPKY